MAFWKVKNRALLIVETPFQLLCAYEYIQRIDSEYDLFIRKSMVGINDEQIKMMITDLDLKVTAFLHVKPGCNKHLIIASLKFLFYSRRSYSQVVLGSFFSGLQQFLATLVFKKKLVLLDDGVASLLADQIIREKHPMHYSAFSLFHLDKSSYCEYLTNDFRNLSAKYLQDGPRQGSFFIGQKLVEIGAISLADYQRTVLLCAESCQDVLYYIPHRAESENTINSLSKFDNIKILHMDVAVEYYFLKNNIYPINVYSIISTALFSINCLFPSSKIVVLHPAELKRSLFVHYQLIQEEFLKISDVVFLDVDSTCAN